MSYLLSINSSMPLMRKRFYNLFLDIVDTGEALHLFNEFFDGDSNKHVFFVNAHCFNMAQKKEGYFKALAEADLVLNDGAGIKLASLFTPVRFKENMNGTDLIPKLVSLANDRNEGIYLLGGSPGIAEKAKLQLEKRYPGVQIKGFHDGYFDKSEEDRIIEDINQTGAKLLILGMGVPLQEVWIDEHSDFLKNIRISVAGGAILDFISGRVSRAPVWMRKSGTEWLYRLYLEPKRMFRRYFFGGFVFVYHIIKLKLKGH